MTITSLQRLALAGSALTVFAAAPSFAQASGAPAAPQQISRAQLSGQLDTEFKDLDANKDGKLTKAEIQTAMTRRAGEAQTQVNQQAKALFDKIDTNHNGSISLAEFQAQEKVSIDPAKVEARVQQLDTNKDGSVSAEEYRNGTLSQFDRVDANHDGVVSAAEASGGASR
jgi:Ca2+-binding EF-hand superfamily protein